MNNLNAHARVCQSSPSMFTGCSTRLCFGRRVFSVLASVFATLAVLAGCSSSGGPGITVQITPTSASVDQGQTLNFTANLANDLRSQGVTWSLSGSNCAGITGAGTSGCGNLSNVTTHAVTYTAPAGLSSSLSVTLTATAVANTTNTKTATITVELPLAFSNTAEALTPGSNGVPYSQSIAVTGGVTPLTFTLVPGSGSLPAGLTMNQSGVITGRPTGPVSGAPNPAVFTVQVSDSSTAPTSATQQYSIFISPASTLQMTAVSPLAIGYPNYPYSTPISTSGGVRPFTYSLASGTLPPGLSLNTSNGLISGTPLCPAGGTGPCTSPPTPYSFTIQVSDSTLPTSQTVTSSALIITIEPPPPLSISPSSLPTGQTATPYSASFAASGGIPNQQSGQPQYTWAITSGQLPPGLHFNTASGTVSGTPILITTSNFTVQVSDSENPPATLSANYSISITAGTNNDSLMTGQYSFLFQGFDSDGAVALGGSLATDGNGKITGGGLDSNRVSGVIGGTTVARATLSGTYSVGTDGRGTMELTATTGLPALTVTLDFDLVLDANGNVHFFEDNSTTTNTDPKKTHGLGIMKPVTQSFATGSFSGNYAFLFTGANTSGKPTALGGVVHSNGSGNIGAPGSGANGDYNEDGTFSSQLAVTGTYSFLSGNHGEAELTFDLPGKSPYTLTFSLDFVSTSDIFFVDIDPADATHARLSGEMILQSPSTTFDATALSGPSVATGTGLNTNASVFAGLLAPATANCTNGVANCVALTYDENNAGTIASPSLVGNFQINPNGRVAFTFNQLSGTQLTPVSTPRLAVAYLYGPGQGFTMGADAAVTTGLLDQQETGVTFSASSIDDNYTLSATFPAENQVPNVIGQTSASGTGSLLGTIDEVTPPPTSNLAQSVAPDFGQSLVGTYSVSATGRATMTSNSPVGFPTNLVLYIVSPSSFRAISLDPSDQHPQVFLFDH